MKDEAFAKLTESIRQAGEIRRQIRQKEEAIEIAAQGRSGAGHPPAWTRPAGDAPRSAQADIAAEGSLGRQFTMTHAKTPPSQGSRHRTQERLKQTTMFIILAVLLLLTYVPLIYLAILSLKDNGQIYGRFWSLPNPVRWGNFIYGAQAIWRPMWNSIITTTISTAGTLVFASLSGYVFARHRFPGKEIIYTAILALLMIPPILTLVPAYVLIYNLHLQNTYWALILPWTSGGQVFALLLCRSFFATLPEEFFDAARIDGASELAVFLRIAAPLSVPILVTVAVVRLVTTYNQFMWPLVVISSPSRQVVAVALTQFTSDMGITDIGPQMAAYILAAVPLVVLFSLGMKQYVQGITAGGLKA